MAEVFAARRVSEDGAVGPMVAVKRLLPHLARDSNVVRMFLNEARITAQIRHPNVVKVLDLGQHEGAPYIAMELLEGHSFAELREAAAHRGERVPLHITLKVLTDACRGLDAAHRAVDEAGRPLCIVHRDFTPDNLHVGVDGRTKVIDFGIAKAANLGVGTEPGTLKGKFFYMSPEMIAGHSVDHRADLYAAGVMLYEQLCGRRPFTGTTPDEVVRRIALATVRRPTDFDPSLPVELERICLLALERDPAKRFESLHAFIAAIESLGGNAELASEAEVAAWVERIFPAEEDERRLKVREARRIDPSGSHRAPDAGAPSNPPRAEHPVRPFQFGKAAAALVVCALLVGGGAAWWSLRAVPTAAELLATADAADAERAAKVKALVRLAKAKDATARELEEGVERLLSQGALEEALALVEARQARFEPSAEGHLLEARAAVALRRGKRAEAAIVAARKLAPESAGPDTVLAELRERQGDLGGAAVALGDAAQRVAKSDPLEAHALELRRGLLLSRAGRLSEAEEALSASVARAFHPEAAAELAFVRFRQDRAAEALPLLRRAISKAPDHAPSHLYMGAVLYRQGDTAGAVKAYAEAERLAPGDPRPLVALCQLFAREGREAEHVAVKARIEQRFADPEEASRHLRECAPASETAGR